MVKPATKTKAVTYAGNIIGYAYDPDEAEILFVSHCVDLHKQSFEGQYNNGVQLNALCLDAETGGQTVIAKERSTFIQILFG